MNLYGIMMKFPEPGKVKTRLAGAIGQQKAAQVYRDVAERIMRKTRSAAYERRVLYSPPELRDAFAGWFPDETLMPQSGHELGEVMHNALAGLFDAGASRAVITGADIPGLTADVIERAFAELEHSDIVIGPACDGGYYLIGMTAPHPEVFRGIEWATGSVCRETIALIKRLGLSHGAVDTLADLDTHEDYIRHMARADYLKSERYSP